MIRRKKKNKTLIVCSVLVVSLITTKEKSRYDVRNIADWREHCVLVWRKILFLSLFPDKHCFVPSLYPFIFLNSVTILCIFCVNYSPPQIRNTRVPNYGIIYDVYVTIVSSLSI